MTGGLLMLLESVSRQVDAYCNRHFFARRAAMVFDGDGSTALRIPDLVSVDTDGLATDDDGDRIFEAAWEDSDYLLHPANADPAGGHDLSSPYTWVMADTEAGARSGFPGGYAAAANRGRVGLLASDKAGRRRARAARWKRGTARWT